MKPLSMSRNKISRIKTEQKQRFILTLNLLSTLDLQLNPNSNLDDYKEFSFVKKKKKEG